MGIYVPGSDNPTPFPLGDITVDGIQVKKLSSAAASASGYVGLFVDSATDEWKTVDETGTVAIFVPKTDSYTASTTSNAWVTLADIPVPTDGSLVIEGVISGKRTDGTFGLANYKRTSVFFNDGGTVTEVLSQNNWNEETNTSYNARINANSTNARLQVRGGAGENMDWVANLQITTPE